MSGPPSRGPSGASSWRPVARGLSGVELVVSDHHPGLKAAIGKALGCPWQRCTVHFLREMLGHVHRGQQGMIAAALRQVFQADSPGRAQGLPRGDRAPGAGGAKGRGATGRGGGRPDRVLLAAEHWPKLRSTNPLERVNREIGRRSDVVGIFPNEEALLRLAASLLIEQNDEWLVGRRTCPRARWRSCSGDAPEPEVTAERPSGRRQPRDAALVCPPAAPATAPSPAARSPPGPGGAPSKGASRCSVTSPRRMELHHLPGRNCRERALPPRDGRGWG